jgi:hypothetical protein
MPKQFDVTFVLPVQHNGPIRVTLGKEAPAGRP